MKNKKGLIIGIIVGVGCLLLVFAAIFVINAMNNFNQEIKLKEEIESIGKLVDKENIDMASFNKKANKLITTGSYKTVEKAVKDYLNDVFTTADRMKELLNDSRLTNLLTAQNYKDDGKDFSKTKEYITKTRDELKTLKSNMIEYLTDQKIMSYIENKKLDSHYINFYKELCLTGQGDISKDQKEFEESIDSIINLLDVSEEIINFLIEKKDNWQVEGNNIVFSNDNLVNKYNDLLGKLK